MDDLSHSHVMATLETPRVDPARGLTVVVLDRMATLRSRDADWLALCAHPEAHPATFEAVCAVNQDLIRPHVVLVVRGEAVVAMAVARLQYEVVPIKFGLATPLRPRLPVVRLSYQGVSGDLTPEVFTLLLEQLTAPLKSGEADALAIDHVKLDCPLRAWSEQPSQGLLGDRAQHQNSVHWVADLHDNFEAFLRSLNKRERARNSKNNKKVERELGGRLRIACYEAPTDAAIVVTETTHIAAMTYQSAFEASFSDLPWAAPMFRAGLEAGLARCFILYIDDQPKAFVHGLVWRGTFYSCFMGYDPDYSALGVGRYLNFRVIEMLSNDPDVRAWDFGFGHAEYKRRVSSTQWIEVDRYVFAPRLKPRMINSLRGVVGRVAVTGDAALAAIGIRENVKQLWHRRVTARNARPETPDAD